MEDVVSRHFFLSELLYIFPSVHPFYHPSSPHTWIFPEAPAETLVCVVEPSTVVYDKEAGQTWDPSGFACYKELSPSCDPRPCSQSCLAPWKSCSDGGQSVIWTAWHLTTSLMCVCVFDSTGQFLGCPRNSNSTDFKNKGRNPEPFCENSQGKLFVYFSKCISLEL